MTTPCSNCNKTDYDPKEALALSKGEHLISVMCAPCQRGVGILKIIVARNQAAEEFSHLEFQPVTRVS